MSRRYTITQKEVRTAWKAVRRAGGCGHDRQTITDVEADLDNQLIEWRQAATSLNQRICGHPESKKRCSQTWDSTDRRNSGTCTHTINIK